MKTAAVSALFGAVMSAPVYLSRSVVNVNSGSPANGDYRYGGCDLHKAEILYDNVTQRDGSVHNKLSRIDERNLRGVVYAEQEYSSDAW